MVTSQELEARQEELDRAEREARMRSEQPIPQRRFGAGVTPEQQQNVIRERQQALQNIQQIQEQRRKIQEVKNQLEEEQRRQDRANRINQAIQSGIKNKSITQYGLNREELEFVRERIKEAEDFSERTNQRYAVSQIEQALQLSLTPEARREIELQSAGTGKATIQIKGLTLQNFNQATPDAPFTVIGSDGQRYPIDRYYGNKVNVNPIKDYLSSYSREESRNVVSLPQKPGNLYFDTLSSLERPLNKADIYLRNIVENSDRSINLKSINVVESAFALSFVSTGKQFINLARNPKEVGTNTVKGIYDLATGKTDLSETRRILREQPFRVLGSGLGLVTQNYLSGLAVSKSINYLNTPVKIYKLTNPKIEFNIAEELVNIEVKGKPISVGSYTIKGSRGPLVLLQKSRLDLIIEKISPVKTIDTQLGRGKILVVDKGKTVNIGTSRIVLDQGEIINNAYIFRESLGQRRGKTVISRLIGKSLPNEVNLKVFKSLSQELKYKLQSAVERKIGRPISQDNLNKYFNKNKDINAQLGEVATIDLFKVNLKDNSLFLKPIPYGRRTSVGSTLSIIEELNLVKKADDKISFIDSTTVIEDITLPKSGDTFRIKQLSSVKGITKITETALTFGDDTGTIIYKNLKQIQRNKDLATIKGTQALSINKATSILKPKTPSVNSLTTQINKPSVSSLSLVSLPLIVGGQGKTNSQYAGKGLYEITEQTSGNIPKNIFKELSINKDLNIYRTTYTNRSLERQINRSINREIPREATRNINIPATREITRQTNRLANRLIQRQINRNPPRSPYRGPPVINIKVPKGSFKKQRFNFIKNNDRYLGNSGLAYRPFIIRGGKEIYLGGALPKGLALRKAELEAKKTLGATFGVKAQDYTIRSKDIKYQVDRNLFRDYRIQKGKRISLMDTFIQRRGKRLTYKSEIKELQGSRNRR